jgi:hypothetical protein
MKRRIKFITKVALVLLVAFAMTFCKEVLDEQPRVNLLENEVNMAVLMNPTPDELGAIPAATVPILEFSELLRLKSATDGPGSSLLPEEFSATMKSEASVTETKTAFVSGAPPKGDVLFMMDLTGSMGGELENAKANSVNIMNAIGSVIADAQFGLVSHMDYLGGFSSCGYSATYGGAYPGYAVDYPYRLDKSITDVKADVQTALNGLALGWGSDLPESYTRVLWETYSDANIGWREGAKRFVVAWLDAPPHDCGLGFGADPGRDGIMDTSDDLPLIEPVLNEMKAQNITLIVLYSGDSFPSFGFNNWKTWAQITGGDAFQINSDGTIPGETDIAEYIEGIILAQTSTISELTVEVCTPGFEGWLTDVDPVAYTDIDLDEPFTGEFELTYTVPAGTVDGVYEFDVCLIGDGAEYGRQKVKITVINTIEVPLDILPMGCPNPFARGSKGELPVAIAGFAGFDVTEIDPATILLEGFAPDRWALEDVATPYEPFIGKPLDRYSCNEIGPDGLMDLTLKFKRSDFNTLLESYLRNDLIKLTLTGQLYDGTPIVGEDIIIIVK